jgi:hypothetical protein
MGVIPNRLERACDDMAPDVFSRVRISFLVLMGLEARRLSAEGDSYLNISRGYRKIALYESFFFANNQ